MTVRKISAGFITPQPALSQLSLSAKTSAGSSVPLNTWTRPSQWLSLPDTTGQQRLVGLYAIFPDANFVALSAAGNYTVDWGDGTTTNHNSGTNALKEYTYSSISNTGESDLGYRQVIIQVYPQAGQNLTTINLQVAHTQSGLNTAYSPGWLDITINAPNWGNTGAIGGVTRTLRMLQQVTIIRHNKTSLNNLFSTCRALQSVPLFDTSAVTNMSSMFFDCNSLQTVPLFNTAAVTTMAGMFEQCDNLISVPHFNTSAVTNMSSMFRLCRTLVSVPLFNTASVTNMASMFTNCTSLTTVPLFNTAAVTNMGGMFNASAGLITVPLFNTGAVTSTSSMFQNCTALQSVPLFNTAAVTNTSSMFNGAARLTTVPAFNTAAVLNCSSMFNGCTALQTVPALNLGAVNSSTNMASAFTGCSSLSSMAASGINQTVSFASAKLSATQINQIFTNLSANGTGKTVTVTGNYGASTCDTTIATAKGWSVTV